MTAGKDNEHHEKTYDSCIYRAFAFRRAILRIRSAIRFRPATLALGYANIESQQKRAQLLVLRSRLKTLDDQCCARFVFEDGFAAGLRAHGGSSCTAPGCICDIRSSLLYFIFRIPNSIWPFFVEVSSELYQQVWVLTEPIEVVFYVLMVVELYRLVLEKYKGLYSLGRWALYLSLAISVGISAITLLPRIKPSMAQRSKIMFYVIATERGIHTALAIFIILISGFPELFPGQIEPECSRTCAGIFDFLSEQHVYVADAQRCSDMHLADEVNAMLMGITAASVVAWLTLLRPAGEDSRPFAGACRAGVRKPAAGAPGFAQRGAAADFRPLEVILIYRFSTPRNDLREYRFNIPSKLVPILPPVRLQIEELKDILFME